MKTQTPRLLGLLIVAGLLGVIGLAAYQRFSERGTMRDQILHAHFPLRILTPLASIVEPNHLEYAAQYQLLENLAVGLIRDDVTDATGYAPILASSWQWDGDRQWQFQLRDDLKWSDGKPLTSADVIESFERLRTSRSLHIVHLLQSESIASDGPRTVVIRFKERMDERLLHELSLADAVVFKVDASGKPRWDVTSGPYRIAEYDPGKRLVLAANPHYAAYSPDMIPTVELTPSNRKMTDADYPFAGMDLAEIPSPPFSPLAISLIERAERVVWGAASTVHMLAFRPDSIFARSRVARCAVGAAVRTEFIANGYPPNMTREDQVLPTGYDGRIQNFRPDLASSPSESISGVVRIRMWASFKESPEVVQTLERAFHRLGAKVEFQVDSKGLVGPDETSDIYLTNMVANQRDALGTWSYLTKANASLAWAKDILDPDLRKASSASNGSDRTDSLIELHRKILADCYLVPLFSERSGMATAARVSLDRWNPFDMRLRFYEVRWAM